jgi:hypothetical protein
MANGKDNDRDDKVGYANPPKHTRWKKGQSGNPTGKRRREEVFQEKVRRIAREEILVRQNGSQTAMSQTDAMLRSIFGMAMKEDVPAFRAIAPFLEAGDSTDLAAGGRCQSDGLEHAGAAA